MQQSIRLNPEPLKMSACSDFVEHIWKPGSCKNCFCLRSDHQLAAGRPQPRAGSLPPRPDNGRLEDDGVSSSPYSKPTIAVKPTMMSSEAPDVWTEAGVSTEVSQVIWRRAPGKLPLPKQEDVPVVYLGSFRGVPKPVGPCASAEGGPRCPPAYAVVGLHSLETRGDRSPAFHPVSFPDDKVGREEKAELPSAQESFRQKLAAFAGLSSGGPRGPRPCPSPPPRGSLPSEDDSDQRCSPSGDSEGGEYCSILDCCPGSPAAQGALPAGGDCSPPRWEPTAAEERRALSGSPGPAAYPPRLGPKKPSLTSEAASSSDGLSCCSRSSGTSSPFAPHLDSDYCSLVKDPAPAKHQDSGGCHVTPSRCLGPAGEPQPREAVLPEPIYAESTKRKKAPPGPPRSQAKAEQTAAAQGQVWTSEARAHKVAAGWSQDREGSDMAPQVGATITVMATHPEEDHRTIYLSSPDSAVGVQWPRGHGSQDSDVGQDETSARQCLSSREGHAHDTSESGLKGRPAIPPKLSKSSPGGSPVSSSPSPLADLGEGSLGPAPVSRGPAEPTPSCRTNGAAASDPVRCPPPAATPSAVDQRRPRYQPGAWSRQCRIEEEEEAEQELLSHSWGRETENGPMAPSSASTWHRVHPTDGSSSSGQHGKASTGMSKSASFAFEFPKDRSRMETFSPPPPPPKSRHLLKMNKSSSDLEKVSQGSAESLSPSFRGVQVSFTTGSTDSLASDSRTASDGGKGLDLDVEAQVFLDVQGRPWVDWQDVGALSKGPAFTTRAGDESDRAQGNSPGTLALTSRFSPAQLLPDSRAVLRANRAPLVPGLKTGLTTSSVSPALILSAENNENFCLSPQICKTPEPKAASYCSPSVPVHFNIQQDCGHFVASVPSSMLAPPDAPKDPQPALPAQPPAQEQDCVVVITREVPHQTASDFVRDSAASHRAEPEAYERRVCFLLLQLCNGLEHLKEHGVIHRDLCLENLLLVRCAPQAAPGPAAPPTAPAPGPAAPPRAGASTAPAAGATPSPPDAPACQGVPGDKQLPRLIISNFLKAKQKPGGSTNLQQKKSQARLAPEIVSASQYRKFDEFQTGILIYELLHQPNPFEVRAQLREQDYRQEDLPPLPALSLYSPGLQQLAHLLLEADPIKRIRIGEAKRVLQCLLWGPRRELVEQPGPSEEALCSTLHNWIDMKRALMMMKFAEKAVDRRRGVELEDWLCCQYLASAEPRAVLQSLKLLQLL
nr:inactive tyrosine-protein kinase PRAG1 [Oryctolagus cuniculus]